MMTIFRYNLLLNYFMFDVVVMVAKSITFFISNLKRTKSSSELKLVVPTKTQLSLYITANIKLRIVSTIMLYRLPTAYLPLFVRLVTQNRAILLHLFFTQTKEISF